MEEGKDPSIIVEERGMKQVTDTNAIETACDAIIAAHPEKVEEIRNGKRKTRGLVYRPGDEGHLKERQTPECFRIS